MYNNSTVEEARFERPFCYKGRAYMRVESVTTTMSQTVYNDLLMQRGGKYGWESMTNPDLQITDLDENAILRAVRAGIDSGRLPETTIREEIPAILEKFDLLHNRQLNNASAVLFGRKFYDYPQCLLRMARFRGINKDEFIDNQRIQGNIYDLLDAAMSFFFKHLSLSAKIEGLYREEELSIPYKALRECCINSFAHRFYHRPGSSVSIAIYDNRVEITNSGAFPTDILNAVALVFRNRNFMLMVVSSGLYSIIKIILLGKIPQLPHSYPTVTPQVEKVLIAIGANLFSAKEIMERMGLKDKSNFLENYLYPVIGLEMVEPLYPEQPKHPKQKYRLTEKGNIRLK